MALHEKKQLLRGMYGQDEAGPATTDTPADSHAVENPSGGSAQATIAARQSSTQPLDNRIERYLRPVATFVLFLPFLLGLGAIGWKLYGHWHDGVSFRTGLDFIRYIRDTFQLAGLMVFIILLGLAAAFVFRDILPSKRRWVAFGVLMGLIPLAIAAVPFMPVCYNWGRSAGYHRLDFNVLASDARAIRDTFSPPTPGTTYSFASFDGDYARLPYYTREVLKPSRVYVHDRGITLELEASSSPFNLGEGLAIPLYGETAAEARKHARDKGYELLSTVPPVYRFLNQRPELDEFLAPGSPPLPPMTMPWMR